jgi:hypothetical protein
MRELDRKSVTHVTSALPVMLNEAELPLAEAQRVEASLSSSLPVVHGPVQLAIDRQVSSLIGVLRCQRFVDVHT